MPKKRAVLAALLVAVLGMAAPVTAQEEEHVGEGQYTPESDTFTVTHVSPEETSYEGCVAATSDPEACKYLRDGVVQDAKEAAIRAAEEAAGVQNYDQQVNQAKYAADIAAQESMTEDAEGMSPAQKGTAAYLAALQAARDAGANEEIAGGIAAEVAAELPGETTGDNAASESETSSGEDDEIAKEVAAEAVSSSSGASTGKARKGSSPSEGIAAAEGKTRNDQASKKASAQGKDREDKKSRKNKTREDDTATDNASEEDATEDADDEVAASGEDGGTSGEDVATAPARGRITLLLGGIALLSIGGYAGLRFVQSRSLIRVRRLLRS